MNLDNKNIIPSYTTGGELYFEDGTKYIGSYHLDVAQDKFFTHKTKSSDSVRLYALEQLSTDVVPDIMTISVQDQDISLNYLKYKIFRSVNSGIIQNIIGIFREKPEEKEGQNYNLYTTSDIEKASKKLTQRNKKGVNIVKFKAYVENDGEVTEDDIEKLYYKIKPSKWLVSDLDLAGLMDTSFNFFVDEVIDPLGGIFEPGTFFRIASDFLRPREAYTYYFVERNNDITQIPNWKTVLVMLKERNQSCESIFIIEQEEFFNFNLLGMDADLSNQWYKNLPFEIGCADPNIAFDNLLDTAEEIAEKIAQNIPNPPKVLVGAPGAVGPIGPAGAPGSAGPAGAPGEIGGSGSDGKSGKDGKDGKDGRDGKDGECPDCPKDEGSEDSVGDSGGSTSTPPTGKDGTVDALTDEERTFSSGRGVITATDDTEKQYCYYKDPLGNVYTVEEYEEIIAGGLTETSDGTRTSSVGTGGRVIVSNGTNDTSDNTGGDTTKTNDGEVGSEGGRASGVGTGGRSGGVNNNNNNNNTTTTTIGPRPGGGVFGEAGLDPGDNPSGPRTRGGVFGGSNIGNASNFPTGNGDINVGVDGTRTGGIGSGGRIAKGFEYVCVDSKEKLPSEIKNSNSGFGTISTGSRTDGVGTGGRTPASFNVDDRNKNDKSKGRNVADFNAEGTDSNFIGTGDTGGRTTPGRTVDGIDLGRVIAGRIIDGIDDLIGGRTTPGRTIDGRGSEGPGRRTGGIRTTPGRTIDKDVRGVLDDPAKGRIPNDDNSTDKGGNNTGDDGTRTGGIGSGGRSGGSGGGTDSGGSGGGTDSGGSGGGTDSGGSGGRNTEKETGYFNPLVDPAKGVFTAIPITDDIIDATRGGVLKSERDLQKQTENCKMLLRNYNNALASGNLIEAESVMKQLMSNNCLIGDGDPTNPTLLKKPTPPKADTGDLEDKTKKDGEPCTDLNIGTVNISTDDPDKIKEDIKTITDNLKDLSKGVGGNTKDCKD